MFRSLFAVAALALALPAVAGVSGVRVSPFPNWAGGPSQGPASALFDVVHTDPDSVAKLVPQVGFDDGDFQWFNVPLSLPVSDAAGRISDVQVCFRTNSANNTAYISQTRITTQTNPGSASVVLDDPTDRSNSVGGCYVVPVGHVVSGATTLRLKVVMGDPRDSIEVSQIFLKMTAR